MIKELIAHENPKSPNSEIFRTLRTNIQFMNTNKKLKTLLITSTFPREGKSWVTSNLAVTFAQAGKKVLLIDADMRKGRQYKLFEVDQNPGLSNFLAETEIDEEGKCTENIEKYIQQTKVENLSVFASGNVPPNPSELLVSKQMIILLESLKPAFDLIIIDGTPCELVTDSIILSRIVDSCVIVTAHKSTKKDALDRVIKNIRNVGGNLAGVVINKVPSNSRRYGNSYYYYGERTSLNKKKESLDEFANFSKNNKIDSKQVEKDIAKLEEEIDEIKEEQKTENKELSKTEKILKQINDFFDEKKKKN